MGYNFLGEKMSENNCQRCVQNRKEVTLRISSKNDASHFVDHKMCRACAEEVAASINSTFHKQAKILPV